jgi:hypothetical protein
MFVDQVALLANTTFKGRARIAMLTAARTTLESSTDSGRIAAARRAIDSPDDTLERAMSALIASSTIASEATADPTGAGITDAELQTAMNLALITLVR